MNKAELVGLGKTIDIAKSIMEKFPKDEFRDNIIKDLDKTKRTNEYKYSPEVDLNDTPLSRKKMLYDYVHVFFKHNLLGTLKNFWGSWNVFIDHDNNPTSFVVRQHIYIKMPSYHNWEGIKKEIKSVEPIKLLQFARTVSRDVQREYSDSIVKIVPEVRKYCAFDDWYRDTLELIVALDFQITYKKYNSH